MLVAPHSFASIWSSRTGNHRNASAHFNTTGILVGERFRHRSCLYGHVRIDECTGFRPDRASEYIGRVFDCDPLQALPDKRKLFIRSLTPHGTGPDAYLISVRSDNLGTMPWGENFTSSKVQIISFSEGNGKQEALLLMAAFSWVRSSNGTFCIDPNPSEPWRCQLVMLSDNNSHPVDDHPPAPFTSRHKRAANVRSMQQRGRRA